MKFWTYLILILVLVGVIGTIVYYSNKNKTAAEGNNGNSSTSSAPTPQSLFSGDISMPGATATIYYGNGCPHCANVEDWLQSQGYLPAGSKIDQKTIDSWITNAKVKFNAKEVWYNSANASEMQAKASAAGIASDQVGVPLLYDSANNKVYIGETDVENYFSTLK